LIKGLLELYRYRNLIKMLVTKELKARYRGTFLGFLWSFLNPLIAMLSYVLVFSVYMKVQMENYSVFLLSGFLPWTWFASSINEASKSILINGGLIKKIYMPTEIFPCVYVISNLINFLFSLPVLLLLILFLNLKINLSSLLFFPLLIIVQLLFTAGIAFFVSSMTVKFRDFVYVIPNIITIWYFLTPIMYPSTLIPEKFKLLLWLNPFALLSIAYQDILYYNRPPSMQNITATGILSLIILLFGLTIFNKLKGSFPEET